MGPCALWKVRYLYTMYCVRPITADAWWVGGEDRRLALFENAFPIPRGISYNSYLILD